MGTGYGFHLALLGLLVCLAGSNRATIGVFCLLFGAAVLGYVAETFGYVGWGGDVIVAVGLLLLLTKPAFYAAILQSPRGLLLILWCTSVFVFFYLLGFQSNYSLLLLINYSKTVLLTFIGFLFLFSDRSVNWTQLGLMTILGSILYVAAAGRLDSSILPGSIFDIGCLRTALNVNVKDTTRLFTHYVGFMPVCGFLFLYCKNVSQPKRLWDLILLAITLFAAMVLIAWSGARQSLIFLLLGSASIFLCQFEGKLRRYLLPAAAVGLVLALFVGIGVARNLTIYKAILDPNVSIYDKLNRSMVYNQAFSQIAERPLLGHGLGGYQYSLTYTRKVEREYAFAHNVLLDMLVQTGLFGTVAFFLPYVLFRAYRKRFPLLRHEIHGNVILPIFIVYVLRMLVDDQLFGVGAFVGIIASMDLVQQVGPCSARTFFPTRPMRSLPPAGDMKRWPHPGLK